jgi:hypothetical protein
MQRLSKQADAVAFMGDELMDVAAWLKATPRCWSQSSSVRDRASDRWDLNAGYHGAERLAREGWADGARVIHNNLAVNFPNAHIKEPAWKYDVAGALPDVPRFLAGAPGPMMNHGRAKGRQPVVHIVVNVVCSANVGAKEFSNYGTALVALIDTIENSGRRVELDVAAVFSGLGGWSGKNKCVTAWKVKRANDPVDLAAIAFSIAHPAAFRRIMFAMVERSPSAWNTPGYGFCAKLTPELAELIDAGDAFLLDGVGEARGQCTTPAGALQLAQAQLDAAMAKRLVGQ